MRFFPMRLFTGLFLLFLPIVLSARTILLVTDQSSFNSLHESLNNAIKMGEKDILVNISRGTYVAKENHLRLKGMNYPDVKICIFGNGSIIVPDGNEYKNGDKYKGEINPNNSWMCGPVDINTWSDVYYAEGLVEIIDDKEKKCRLKSKKTHTNFSNGATHILIPHWYLSSIYKIDKNSGNYIYFTAPDLKASYINGYNLNDDYNYGKNSIRYKLFNAIRNKDCVHIFEDKIILPKGVSKVRESFTSRLINFQNCNFHSLEITGLKFYGNSFANNKSAIYFNEVNCNIIWIHDCEFRGMRSDVLTLSSSSNVRVENNLFADCYNYGIQSDNNSRNTVIKDNTFSNMGKSMQNTFCIVCRGDSFCVAGNKMTDFGCSGIGVGVWYKSPKNNLCRGFVENNELTYTETYMSDISNYGIMDSGAIYLWTKIDGIIIRDNYIHGYSGVKDNRGIFCDDGAYNFQIYDNVIIDIFNSYCIDSRRVVSVENSKTPGSGIERANTNIVIRDNIVDGDIRYEAHDEFNNGCIKGANYILIKKGGRVPKNSIKNIVNPVEDIPLEFVGKANGKLFISSQSYRKLKKSKSFKQFRKHIGKY